MNRIDRISAILIQLQSRRTVKARDIAERFHISLRTVYRDVKTLEEAGVPIIGEAGVGYSLVEGYRLPPIMFTRDEAASFLTAEKMVDKLTDSANSEIYRSAMYKIKAVLRSTDIDYLEHIDKHIAVLRARGNNHHSKIEVNALQTILQALSNKQVLTIAYQPAYKETGTDRNIEPIGVFYLDNYWHLIAYCRLRNDYRDFRFDRIKSIAISDLNYETIHPPLKDHLDRLYQTGAAIEVTIRVSREAAAYLGEQRYYHGFVSEIENTDDIEMQFLNWSLEGFARWYMTFADHAQIIEPQSLKDSVRNMIEKISKNL
jgi:predicted DNA-binding transcriptional regulator YafY